LTIKNWRSSNNFPEINKQSTKGVDGHHPKTAKKPHSTTLCSKVSQ
jgi:hypothetical protein